MVLLAVSLQTTILLVSVGGGETAALGAIGSTTGQKSLTKRQLRSLSQITAARSAIVIIVVYVVVIGLFAVSGDSRALLLATISAYWPALLSPLVAIASPAYTAYLISRGLISTVLLTNALRTVPLAAAVALTLAPAIQIIAILAGEILRVAVVATVALRATREQSDADPEAFHDARQLTFASLIIQTAWLATSQLSLSLLRVVFASGPPGVFTAGETAIRLQNVASQVTISGFVLSKVADIPADFQDKSGASARRRATVIMAVCFLAGATVSLLITATILPIAFTGSLPAEIANGLLLGALLCASCAPVAASTWASRAITYRGRNGVLLLIGGSMTALIAAVFFTQMNWLASSPAAAVSIFVILMLFGGLAYGLVARHRMSFRD